MWENGALPKCKEPRSAGYSRSASLKEKDHTPEREARRDPHSRSVFTKLAAYHMVHVDVTKV